MLRDFTKEKFDIIIQAGQSNAEGSGYGDVEKPYSENSRVLYIGNDFENEFIISIAKERARGNRVYGDFSLSFVQKYIDEGYLEDSRNILILRAAIGGTGFSDNRWKINDVLYNRMMDMIQTALSLNKENRIVAFLWHQGETDSCNKMTSDYYYEHFGKMLKAVREAHGIENIPFIAANFVKQWRDKNDHPAWADIISAMKKVIAENPNCAFIETDNLSSNDEIFHNGDDIHFSRQALYKLGEMYFEEFKKLKA